MAIRKLRTFYSPEELPGVYASVYDHSRWDDHVERVAHTIEALDRFASDQNSRTLADLSCGDGAIALGSRHPWQSLYLSDFVPHSRQHDSGPIEQTIRKMPTVDMFILSETLEHVEEPQTLLRDIAYRSKAIILSTPEGEMGDANPQHYWGWDSSDVTDMLGSAGWDEVECWTWKPTTVDYYTFQFHTATSKVTR